MHPVCARSERSSKPAPANGAHQGQMRRPQPQPESPYMKKLFGLCGLVSGLALTLTSIASAQSARVAADQSVNQCDDAFTAAGLPQIFDVWHPLNVAYPRIAVDDSLRYQGSVSSLNWSGYADTATPAESDTIATVTGSWIVPAVTSTAGNGVAAYSAIWVGIDGFDDGTVEQLGTLQAAEVVTQGRGRNQKTTTETLYYAWVEMYPAGMVELPYAVNPGDVITATVTWQGGGSCTLYMQDTTVSGAVNWTYGPTSAAGFGVRPGHVGGMGRGGAFLPVRGASPGGFWHGQPHGLLGHDRWHAGDHQQLQLGCNDHGNPHRHDQSAAIRAHPRRFELQRDLEARLKSPACQRSGAGSDCTCPAPAQQFSLWPCDAPPGEGTRPTRWRLCRVVAGCLHPALRFCP